MSRILRRPMFRGGGTVDSYGKGITAPLVPGYMGGGQIGGGIIYGKPMADGRFGFQAPVMFNAAEMTMPMSNVEKSLGGGSGITTGSELLRAANKKLRSDDAYGIPAGVAMKETETTTEDEGEKSKTIEEIMMENKQYGNQNPSELPDNSMTKEEKLIESYTPKPNKDFIDLLSKESTYQDQEGNIRSTTTGEIIKGEGRVFEGDEEMIGDPREPLPDTKLVKMPGDGEPTIKETEESTEIDPKDAIAANQKLFAELLGSDKARGQDIGDMLLRFSGSGGNTLGEKFQNYVRAESAAGPSRSEKIKQTAAGLAINDYVAGKRSKEQVEALKTKIDYTQDRKSAAIDIQETDNVSTALAKMSKLTDSSFDSLKNIKALINNKTGRSDIYQGTIKIDDLKKQNKLNKLKPGYNIIEDEGIKRIVDVQKQGENNVVISIETISELWSG